MKIYTASKFSRANMWKQQFAQWKCEGLAISLNARWVNDYSELVPDHPQFCKLGWLHDVDDVSTSDLLILYADNTEHLRGALVEVGVALAKNKPVIIIGNHPDYGTWQFHPLIHKVDDFAAAKLLLKLFLLDKVQF